MLRRRTTNLRPNQREEFFDRSQARVVRDCFSFQSTQGMHRDAFIGFDGAGFDALVVFSSLRILFFEGHQLLLRLVLVVRPCVEEQTTSRVAILVWGFSSSSINF